MTNMSNKNTLRRMLLADRQTIGSEVRLRWDSEIGECVLAHLDRHPVRTLGVYWPIRGEPDLRPIFPQLQARGIRLALPVVQERDAPLCFAAWAPGEALKTDALGVAVPAMVVETKPDALLIPCVGFNSRKMRLGYGGGFYDRTLASVPRPLTLGIAYAGSRVEFEEDAHDVALDIIITEQPQQSA